MIDWIYDNLSKKQIIEQMINLLKVEKENWIKIQTMKWIYDYWMKEKNVFNKFVSIE